MAQASMRALQQSSFLSAGNAAYLEFLYQAYLQNPDSIPPEWRSYFHSQLGASPLNVEPNHALIQQEFQRLAHPLPEVPRRSSLGVEQLSLESLSHEKKQTRVLALIDAYRLLGHLHADLDPLLMTPKPLVPELMLSYYQLTEADLAMTFSTGSLPGESSASLNEILDRLKQIYCGHIASEYMHIPDSPERLWVEQQLEERIIQRTISNDQKIYLMKRLIAAEGLEKYIAAKFPGAKRFSLEGCDTLIIALDTLIRKSGETGLKELVIGMAHRGRLNVLVNILGKSSQQLFDEFAGKPHDAVLESGDVKYHQGFSSDVNTPGGPLHLSLSYNPSHLECVNPVVNGSVRARLERRQDQNCEQVASLQIHGDASVAGQGIVMETLNMSQTRAFYVGGSIHIIVNNQIGFTTSDPAVNEGNIVSGIRPRDARSTLYCSDIGKMMGIPILHVNADDPEAVVKVLDFAVDYRIKFKKDIIVDLIGYRRLGHNEADEPAATQPLMYHIIRKLPTAMTLYGKKLIDGQLITEKDMQMWSDTYRDQLEAGKTPVALNIINQKADASLTTLALEWQAYTSKDWREKVKTAVDPNILKNLGEKLQQLPENMVLHPQVKKIMEERAKMTWGERPLDWGFAEIMAYATLVNEGFGIRMSGQDSQRGTFFHRHAVLHNQTNGEVYTPLKHISKTQGDFNIFDSLLSEEAVLGFEYGYSGTMPKTLTLWEAQFGDFANNAQVIIDQFICSGEHKWGRLSGLTLLLPQGYEGQGPEHSSARVERYLQLCAENNMQVCMPSTPAQLFHMLRRQMLRKLRKPLIVITPKSFLRHKLAVSSLADLSEGEFYPILNEIDPLAPNKITRVLLTAGKLYYELLQSRREKNIEHIAILRLEQLYPFPDQELQKTLANYPLVREIFWCQEEPENQGAWYSNEKYLRKSIASTQTLHFVGRKASAAPAVGYLHLHQVQQQEIVTQALAETVNKDRV